MRGTLSYTPFGYLRNPGHRAESWDVVEGGNLRTPTEWVGVEWVYPLQRNPSARHGIRIATSTYHTRADFEAAGLTSEYHSANVLGFDWPGAEAHCFLVDDDTLCVRAVGHDIEFVHFVQGDVGVAHVLATATGDGVKWAALARAASNEQARHRAEHGLRQAEQRWQHLLAEDAAFSATCPRLSGDWPGGWREGLHYDLETTRLLVQPPGGIFQDVWPAWMSAWPRVVLAEGTLDMLRLAYADASLAQRAVLSMFRDVPMANVPCVFENGGYNMLAADGSRCGTSPAWCLPFLNLQLLYLRTLDREWLQQLYPHLGAYLEFWLAERIDPRGWVVYKCTWESGEDGNPRLDPTGSGESVISDRVRPVELQATMAHAARVMCFFATELGSTQDVPRWRALEEDYQQRTRELFDPSEGRFRDWLTHEDRFQEPRPDQPYWGVDSCRFSPLSLTPLLLGEKLPEDEVWRHATAPWTWWPSWTYALVESAAAAGYFERVGEIAAEIVERVYRVTTRLTLADLRRPLPGCAPEFWPEDWSTYDGHDAYGWGATTAQLLLRHVFGFKESMVTDTYSFELTPAVPERLRPRGCRLGVERLYYRGVAFDLAYSAGANGVLQAELTLDRPEGCRVLSADKSVYTSTQAASEHRFELQNGQVYRIELA